jgi:N-acetylmuramoyl-L-alanine amidase
MPWSSDRLGGRLRQKPNLSLVLIVGVVLTSAVLFFSVRGFSAAVAPPDNNRLLSIYSNAANYSLPLSQRFGQDYVSLLDVLDPLGKVTARTEGNHWKVRFNDGDAEFVAGKKRARLRRTGFDLPFNFLLENGRGMVPLSSLPQILSRILGGPVTFNENSRRLIIGNAGVHFTAQVSKTANPALVLNFTAPVNPSIATEPGKLHMHFSHEALESPASPVLTFDSKTIPSASYEQSNGAADITVNGAAPLFATFSSDRKTITITAAPQTAAQTQSAPATPGAPAPGSTSTGLPSSSGFFSGASAGSTSGQRKYFAVIDASHGGDDRGATLSDQLAEKDITLAFARQLRQQLESRGIITLLLRDGDINLSLDQRASQTNSAHPAIYLCVHAASQGTGVRIYTALIPAGGESHGPFISWDTAQAASIPASQAAAASVAVELRTKQISVRTLAAPLRPLNNINVPAIALEISPPSGKIADLSSPDYEQLVASTVAAGIADARAKLEALP